jgi:DNA-binding Lrp family transcriptional regulator
VNQRHPRRLNDAIDRQILAKLQGDFPICERPYAEAPRAGHHRGRTAARLERLLADKVLTRFGPMFQIERWAGLRAGRLAVPEARYEEVTALVNALPQVAHNYRREHTLNMWFVLATETPAGIAEAIARIERDTGLPVLPSPRSANSSSK